MELSTVEKGRVAEAIVIADLTKNGYEVFTPIFGNARCDLIALDHATSNKIEVKYTSSLTQSGSVEVSLRQIRANRAQTQVKKYCSANSDYLAVYSFPFDSIAYIRASVLDGRSTINLTLDKFGAGIGKPIG